MGSKKVYLNMCVDVNEDNPNDLGDFQVEVKGTPDEIGLLLMMSGYFFAPAEKREETLPIKLGIQRAIATAFLSGTTNMNPEFPKEAFDELATMIFKITSMNMKKIEQESKKGNKDEQTGTTRPSFEGFA